DGVRFEDCPRLRGDFAVAAIEGAGDASALLLARGRFGGRPLFFVRPADGVLVACSRVPPLLALVSPLRADLVGLASVVWMDVAQEHERTVFEGVTRVRACEALRVARDRVDHVRWGVEASPHAPATVDELAEELEARLRAAAR